MENRQWAVSYDGKAAPVWHWNISVLHCNSVTTDTLKDWNCFLFSVVIWSSYDSTIMLTRGNIYSQACLAMQWLYTLPLQIGHKVGEQNSGHWAKFQLCLVKLRGLPSCLLTKQKSWRQSLKVNLMSTPKANVHWLSDRANWALIIQIESVACDCDAVFNIWLNSICNQIMGTVQVNAIIFVKCSVCNLTLDEFCHIWPLLCK